MAAVALCANRFHNGDLYLQLATGRFIDRHGFAWHDPFPTIQHGRPWSNQQWLSELFFYRLWDALGMTALTVVYALVLALPLFWLLWYCRGCEPLVLAGGVALYFPALISIVHPRAAGFSLLLFTATAAILLHVARDDGSPAWALFAAPAVFAVWANLHGGLVAGLFLIALVAAGLAIDGRRGPAVTVASAGVLSFAATFTTPLGADLWSYIVSFGNSGIRLASTEWGSAFQAPLVLLYLVATGAFAAWLWRRRRPGTPLTPLLVAVGFLLATVYSLRNTAFVGPALFFLIAYSRERTGEVPLRPAIAAAAGAALVAIVVWAAVLGPAEPGAYLEESPAADALAHPPERGRIAALGGVSSYLLWRDPRASVYVNGWLEHFTAAQLRANYGVVRGRSWAPDPVRAGIGAVITRSSDAVARLRRRGFRVAKVAPEGTYLVLSRRG